jgi:hypothetical protein
MRTPITLAMLANAIKALASVPAGTLAPISVQTYKWPTRAKGSSPVPPVRTLSFVDAQIVRAKIADETCVESTLARIAVAAKTAGLVLKPVFELNADGKTYTQKNEVDYTLFPSAGGGFRLEAKLFVPEISI